MDADVVVSGRQPKAGSADLYARFTAIGRNDFDDKVVTSVVRVPKRDLEGKPDEVSARLHRVVIEHIGQSDPEYLFEFLVRGYDGGCEVVVSKASLIAHVRNSDEGAVAGAAAAE
jgi:hypothetical protein